jgi:hypothetical protein
MKHKLGLTMQFSKSSEIPIPEVKESKGSVMDMFAI